ncbi:MAG: hypothetical protein J6L82_09660 [Alphaproteobacteria bacterium]|nr:hypothetical protein [Alphaproteobacteria bacterium]
MKKTFFALALGSVLLIQGCASFKAERLSTAEGDEKAMSITDEWLLTDTEIAVKDIIKQLDSHRGYQRYLAQLGHRPRLFIAEVQNETSEAYFPIDDLNDELLNEFSASGDYVLIDAAARDKILKELQYQSDGMVKASDIKKVGKATGAEVLIFGAVRMNPKTLNGKTIKEYTVNLRITEIESGEEVARVRTKTSKYSKRSGFGW